MSDNSKTLKTDLSAEFPLPKIPAIKAPDSLATYKAVQAEQRKLNDAFVKSGDGKKFQRMQLRCRAIGQEHGLDSPEYEAAKAHYGRYENVRVEYHRIRGQLAERATVVA